MKRKGFTLIELVVVMAIIAILVALMVAALQAARAASAEAERRANVKTVETALEAKFSKDQSYSSGLTSVANFASLAASLKAAGYLSQDLPGAGLTGATTASTAPIGYSIETAVTATGYKINACGFNSAAAATPKDSTCTQAGAGVLSAIYTATR
jgi:prepilin-type N-terminal cleavage/methylation domain-containing protein